MELTPLVRSAEFDDVEREFKALFLSLYKAHINDQVDEVALYGMPHIGPDSLVERSLVVDGLAVLRTTTMEQIRYLFHAWRYRNPQRGTKFLAAYLMTLFGPVFTIDQLWCKKAGEYPADSMTEAEILVAGEDIADYFLTSRLRVDIETEIVPERILKAAKTALAARFVLELRAARRAALVYPLGFVSMGVQVVRTTGKTIYHQPVIESSITVGPMQESGAATLIYSVGPLAEPAAAVMFGGEFVVLNGARVVVHRG
ncbi:hypothetical protein [Pseudomonas sp. UMAB-40]|uniref:hypothetical protein n=1 Tax=Pseudomonas sp. UMAB-40 TaxID=1365407 RepID=UPI001C562E78|nr:hypothetical protein [Pseudomonas sp. UMAB-40]